VKFAAIAVLALALLQVSSAAPSLTLTASSLRSEGDVTSSSSLLAILMEDTLGNATPVPSFTLEAASLHMETDTAEPVVHVGPVVVNPVKDVTYKSSPRDLGQSVLRFIEARDAHRVNVYGAAGTTAELQSDCVGLRPADAAEVRREPRVYYSRPATVVGTQNALLMESCGSTTLTVRGNFVLVAWEADLELEFNGTKEHLETGRLRPSEPAPDTRPFSTRDQEIYFTAHDATLTIPDPTGIIYLQAPKVAASGRTIMEGASGRFDLPAAGVDLQNARLVLNGVLDVGAASQGVQRPFAVQAVGELQSASADGQTLSVAPVHPTSGLAAMGLWFAIVSGIVAIVALVMYRVPPMYYRHLAASNAYLGETMPTTRRQRRAMGYWAMARYLEDQGHHRTAIVLSRFGSRLAPEIVDHHVLRGLCHLELGQLPQAYEELKRADAGYQDPERVALNALELASVCARMGRDVEARGWFSRAATLEPDLEDLVRNRPELVGLAGTTFQRPAQVAPDPSVA
jgi:hypothetical protein